MRSDKEWVHWGRTDPLWGVSPATGKERGGVQPWTAEQFMAIGATDFAELLPIWRSYGMGHKHCIEIGCGSGRMTNQLLSVFERVTALDVSAEQIENAKRLLGSKADRVHFAVVSEPEIPLPDGSADAMFSCGVFLHFSSFDGVERYLRSAFAKLEPGSSIAFEVPVVGMQAGSEFWHLCQRLLTKTARTLGRRSIMERRSFHAPQVFEVLSDCGYVARELRVCPPERRSLGRGRFFARTPDGAAGKD